MGRIKKGILNGFSGKVGNVVGYEIGDKAFIRSMPIRKAAFTQAELANQAKFKLVNDYIKPFKELLKVGFKNYYTPTGGIRAAISYTLRECVVKENDSVAIDASKIKISGGKLAQALNAAASVDGNRQLLVTWDYSPEVNGNDQLLLLVYNAAKGLAFYVTYDGPLRKEKQLQLTLPFALQTSTVDVYIGIIAADRTQQSDSQYLGRFELE